MSMSMRELFGRQGISDEVISLRNSLANHPHGLTIGLREAKQQLSKLADGNGFARGCRHPGTKIGDLFGITEFKFPEDIDPLLALPEWVPVAGKTELVHGKTEGGIITSSLREDYAGETRTVEGILTKSKITHTDVPFRPWHIYYDWNFHIKIDPQYMYILSPAVLDHEDGSLECEWDTGVLPKNPGTNTYWMLPQVGDRVWIMGRWIYDCGHAAKNGHRTEIHPPKAIASFRSEAAKFRGNSGPTQANKAFLYIGTAGGYWDQPINNQDYAFDLPLPRKPYSTATPLSTVLSMTGPLPVEPEITPYPAYDPKVLRIVVPLSKVQHPYPREYGAIISGGWSDQEGKEAAKVRRIRVTVEKIILDKNYDSTEKGEWYPYFGINGRWRAPEQSIGRDADVNFSLDLDLHPDDFIHVTACGFEADRVHSIMGRRIGLSWIEVCDAAKTKHNLNKIVEGYSKEVVDLGRAEVRVIDPTLFDENEPLGLFSERHKAKDVIARGRLRLDPQPSDKRDYRLQYSFSVL